MSKKVEETEVNEVAEVKDEVMLVSTKDAFKSLGHNFKSYVTDPETYKRAGKRLAKLGAICLVGLAVSKGVDAVMNKDDDSDYDGDVVDADDYSVVDSDVDSTADVIETAIDETE